MPKRTKGKKSGPRPLPSGPTELARRLGVSKQAVSKRLLRGESAEHIEEAIRLRRARVAAIKGDADTVADTGSVVRVVNGSVGAYSTAAARRLEWQARREQLKYQREADAVVPVAYCEALTLGPVLWLMQERALVGPRLRDELDMKPGAECEQIVDKMLAHNQAELARRLKIPPGEDGAIFDEWLCFLRWRAEQKQTEETKQS